MPQRVHMRALREATAEDGAVERTLQTTAGDGPAVVGERPQKGIGVVPIACGNQEGAGAIAAEVVPQRCGRAGAGTVGSGQALEDCV